MCQGWSKIVNKDHMTPIVITNGNLTNYSNITIILLLYDHREKCALVYCGTFTGGPGFWLCIYYFPQFLPSVLLLVSPGLLEHFEHHYQSVIWVSHFHSFPCFFPISDIALHVMYFILHLWWSMLLPVVFLCLWLLLWCSCTSSIPVGDVWMRLTFSCLLLLTFFRSFCAYIYSFQCLPNSFFNMGTPFTALLEGQSHPPRVFMLFDVCYFSVFEVNSRDFWISLSGTDDTPFL